MPRKKTSRAPSRAKPTLPSGVAEVDLELEERKKKLDLLLKDFDVQVAERISEMEKEMQDVQESVRNMYKRDLSRYSETTRNMLWSDYIKQGKESKPVVRKSVDDLINSADVLLAASKPKKGRGKVNADTNSDSAAPPSATRSSRNSRQKKVLGLSQNDNMQPPPSTSRAPRSRKINMDPAATPANQGISAAHMSSMIVTPKFDPRTPLPPGTIKRKPKLGEIAISLTGSPLQVSPKGWFSTLSTDNIDEETIEELKLFHERVGKLLNK